MAAPAPQQIPIVNLNMILESVRRFFAAHVDSARIDREQVLPPEVLQGLKDLGFPRPTS